MRRSGIIAAALVVLALPFTQAAAQAADRAPRVITVTGEGEAAAAPDMATIRLGVTERADTAQAAMDAASGVAERLLAALSEFGIDARDVQTTDLSLSPVLGEPDGPGRTAEVTGFEASNRVTVRVRRLDDLPAILGAALEDGANRLDGLNFAVSNPDPLLDEARRAAVEDARARASLFAEAAGVTLGPVRSISEQGGYGGPMPVAEMRMAAVPIAAGEAGYSASVTMVFGIED